MVGNGTGPLRPAARRVARRLAARAGEALEGRGREEGAEMIAIALTLPLLFLATALAVQVGVNTLYMTTLTSELEQAADYVDVSGFEGMSESARNAAVKEQIEDYGLAMSALPDSLTVTGASFTSGDAAAHEGKGFDPYSPTHDYAPSESSGYSGSWTKEEGIEQDRRLYVDVNGNGRYDAGTDRLEGQTADGVNPDYQTQLSSMHKTERVGLLTYTARMEVPCFFKIKGLSKALEKTVTRERVIGRQVEVQGS